MAADAADELESVANAALLLALQALLGGRDVGATKGGVAAGEAMDRLLLSGMSAFDAGSRDTARARTTVVNNNSFENGADATVRTLNNRPLRWEAVIVWCDRCGVCIATNRMVVVDEAAAGACEMTCGDLKGVSIYDLRPNALVQWRCCADCTGSTSRSWADHSHPERIRA